MALDPVLGGGGSSDYSIYEYSCEYVEYVPMGPAYVNPYFPPCSPKVVRPSAIPVKKSGRIYIGPFSENPAMPEGFGVDDVLILDNRNNLTDDDRHDPSFRIVDSYKITHYPQKKAIIEVLCDYNNSHPSQYKWEHTVDTALKEWEIHNFGFYACAAPSLFGIWEGKLESCRHADLDNFDIGKNFWEFRR